jgi:hypothetical protein
MLRAVCLINFTHYFQHMFTAYDVEKNKQVRWIVLHSLFWTAQSPHADQVLL